MIVLDAMTDFSFMRGFGTPEQWLARCKEIGVTVLGICDLYSTWGHLPFHDTFKGSGIKLLYGARVPVVTFCDKDARHSLITLIAKASTDELYAAMTLAQTQSYYRPRLTWKQVGELEDCFVIVNELLRTHAKVVPETAFVGHRLLLPSHMPDRPRVLAYAPCYPSPEHRTGFELFQAISEQHRLGEFETAEFHLLRESESNAIFKAGVEIKQHTYALAEACSAEPPRGKLMDMGVQGSKREALRMMALVGAERLDLARLRATGDGKVEWFTREYEKRFELELDLIAEKQFEDYFFFIADVVSWAKERMFVGPGRGSAGGSLLCYLLGITTVDPIKFGTLFERFIDVTRSDLPDIDIDFPDTRREEVFVYLRQKYGRENVARLGTLTTLGGKSAINSVARATNVPFDAAREVGKFTEGAGQGVVISPEWVFENVQEVQPILARYPSLRLATVIDGHVSHRGVHASGVVVTDVPCSKYGTVDRDGVLSMDMRTAEAIGLVKMDALGLRTLSVIQETCDLIGMDPRKLYDLDWEDKEVLDGVFNADRVTGVFQFDGHATRQLMKQIRVDKFDDLCALSSLSRPGPLVGGAAAGWVKARNGEAVDDVLHPSLDATYGVICYQEQFMAIARDVAGFDVAQVNGMRRAVAKKDPEKLRGFRNAFVLGAGNWLARNRNLSAEIAIGQAEDLWETICEFGSYAFNYSHAVEYGMISFMTAWLKHKHPLEFAVAQLRNAADEDQAKNILRELVEDGHRYVPFDLEKSQATWAILDGTVYGGFDAIRGIGTKTAERLVDRREREGDGWLSSLSDAQRERIEGGKTRWQSLSYFSDKYHDLYADPELWRSDGIPKGIKPPVLRIRDVPDQKSNVAFLGRIVKRTVVDDDAPERVAKRDGKRRGEDRYFINLVVEDDTGEISGTFNRFKFKNYKWLSEIDINGKDFLFRGNIIETGRRWIFFENAIELK